MPKTLELTGLPTYVSQATDFIEMSINQTIKCSDADAQALLRLQVSPGVPVFTLSVSTTPTYDISGASAAGGGGGDASEATLAAISGKLTSVGVTSDAAASSDTGTFSLVAFVKRALQNWTTLLARIPALVSGRIPVDGSGVTQPVSGVVAIASNDASAVTTYNQTGVIATNTVLMTLDCLNKQSVSISVASLGASGALQIQFSQDNSTNWTSVLRFDTAGINNTIISGAGIYLSPVFARYCRVIVSTATTAGTTTVTGQTLAVPFQQWLATQPVSGSVTVTSVSNPLPSGSNAVGDVGVQYRNSVTGAATTLSVMSPASPAAATIRASSGRLLGWQLQNSSNALRSVKIFNVASPTLGTTAAVWEIDIPAGGRSEVNLEGGIAFSTAIVYSVTSAKGLTDNTATGLAVNDVSGTFFYV